MIHSLKARLTWKIDKKKAKKKNIDNAQKKVDDAQIAEKKVSDDGYANRRIYFFYPKSQQWIIKSLN